MNKVAVLLCSHGCFAQEAAKSAEMIIGAQENYAAVTVDMSLDLEQVRKALAQAYDALDTGRGAVVLVDLFGGTPSNAAACLLGEHSDVLVCTGLHLPMLIELFLNQECSVPELATLLESSYSKAFHNLTALWEQEEGEEDEHQIL